jgi:hypothetical protein
MKCFYLIAASLVACGSFGTPLVDAVETQTLLSAAALGKLDSSALLWRYFAYATPYWDPTEQALEACKAQLRARWGSRRYDLQYYGTTEKGERVLHIQGWCTGRMTHAELAAFPVITFDAGRCHFSAMCRPRTWPRSSLSFSTRGPGR